jgi:hypothetical protein
MRGILGDVEKSGSWRGLGLEESGSWREGSLEGYLESQGNSWSLESIGAKKGDGTSRKGTCLLK